MPVNPTYKNLESKLRVNGLTLAQWAQLATSVLFAALFALFLSPLPPGPTLTVAVMAAGLPLAVSYGLTGSEFSAVRLVHSVWQWRKRPSRYQPGPGTTTGYTVDRPLPPTEAAPAQQRVSDTELEGMWEG